MKNLLLLCFILAISLSAEMQVIVDANRFLDANSNTILEINYEIPYRQLNFLRSDNGFETELKTDLKVYSGGQEVFQQDFTNLIILTNQEATESSENFLDKITLTLAKSDFVIRLEFTEITANKTADWEYQFNLLAPDAILSDLEMSSAVRLDTTEYLQKFHRWDYLFLNNPSHIFDLQQQRILYLYYEIYGFFKSTDDISDLTETISIYRNGELINQEESPITENKDTINRIKQLNIDDLSAGYYELEVKVMDNISGYQEVKKDFFSIKKAPVLTYRIFPDLEDEFKLIKYFLPSSQVNVWKNLTDEGKRNYLNRFWEMNDPNPQNETNEFFEQVKIRKEYADLNFSHHQPGWTSDRGRIYIRHGKPDDILKEKTGFYTKYAIKDYEIWKYRSNEILTYIFIDLLTSGNHKMIYSENDDRENTLPDWKQYLDDEFDETLLQ